MAHHTHHHTVAVVALVAAAASSAAVTMSAPPRTGDQPPSSTHQATATLIADGLLTAPVVDGAHAPARPRVDGELARPHVLVTEIADVIVRIRGGATCTGTPITETTLVLTAAHCVLDDDGEISGTRTVLRDGVTYTAGSVLVDSGYRDSPGPRLDAAVLVMEQRIPGPSARLADVFPTHGPLTLAGFQPLDTDGSLLRGTRHDNRPHPKGATSGVIEIDSAAAGCVHLLSDLQFTTTHVKVPCGLIPGASGGGLFVEHDGETILVGIISTVAPDLAYNGVVPLTAVHELLAHPAEYTHEMPREASTPSTASITRS